MVGHKRQMIPCDSSAADGATHAILAGAETGAETGQGTPHLIRWLEAEVKVRLCEIDRKLDQLAERLDHPLHTSEDGRRDEGAASKSSRSFKLPLPAKFEGTSSGQSSPGGQSQQTIPFPADSRRSSNGSSRFSGPLAATAEKCRMSRRSDVSHESWLASISHTRPNESILKVWSIMNDQDSCMAARFYAATMRYLVWVSVAVTYAQTVQPPFIHGITAVVLETAFDSIFLVEILVRLATCPNPRKFLFSMYNIIDVLAALPLILRALIDFAPLEPEGEEGCFSVCIALIYVVPIVRILKTLRMFKKFHLLLSAFVLALEALPVLLFTLVVILLIFSSLVYLLEPRSNIESLPKAMYFTIITMTTVGYGDIVPTTSGGHIVVSLCTVAGVLYMAMPIGIIGSAFTETWKARDRILLIKRTRENLFQWGYSAEDIPSLFQAFDLDGDGDLCLSEFRKMMRRMRVGLRDERIIELFQSIDSTGGGTIDAQEFMRMLFPAAFHARYEGGNVSRSSTWKSIMNPFSCSTNN